MVIQNKNPSEIDWFHTMLRTPHRGTLHGLLGNRGMANHNAEAAIKMMELLQPKPASVVVEIGNGDDVSMEELLEEYEPSRAYLIESTGAFHQGLKAKFEEELESDILSIHTNDAKNLSFLEDSSVDYIYGLNVIYFFEPLSDYLTEFHRILKPGGTILFGASAVASRFDPKYFINTDWDACAEALAKVGFENATKGEPIPTDTDQLIPISAMKKNPIQPVEMPGVEQPSEPSRNSPQNDGTKMRVTIIDHTGRRVQL